jgi:outer membrane receptor for Fe3+-dicitrate
MEELYKKIDAVTEGQDVDEVIRALAYALADSVAFATDYKFNEENNANVSALVQSAYKFACTENSVTVN